MIRAKFKHSRKGVVFQRHEEITNLDQRETEKAVLSGLAYYDYPKKEPESIVYYKPTEEDNIPYIKGYLNQEGIEFDSSLRKSELLELC